MKQGLLLKEAPEPRFELYCDSYIIKAKRVPEEIRHCNKLFFDEREFAKHRLEVHDLILGKYGGSYYGRTPSWYNIEYDSREGFIRLHFKLPVRPIRRFNTNQEELDNLANKKCWCGKSKPEFEECQIKYCSKEHFDEWWYRTGYASIFKNQFLKNQKRCANCRTKKFQNLNNWAFEMDHIIAIVLGGHPWDERNLQPLCPNCHKIKTKSDVGILAWWRRETKYDPLSVHKDPQSLLENFIE